MQFSNAWRAGACALVVLAAGCAVPKEPARVIRVNVPLPVECKEPVPAKPQMQTDSLASDASLDATVQAMIAEIERRAGYEIELETALANCRRPIDQSSYGLQGKLGAP